MLTLEELRQKVESGEVETVVAMFTDLYGRPMGKRVVADFSSEHTAEKGMHACDYLLTVDMPMEPIPGYSYANWEKGYGDFHCVPDLKTLRMADWLDRTAIVICDVANKNSSACDSGAAQHPQPAGAGSAGRGLSGAGFFRT